MVTEAMVEAANAFKQLLTYGSDCARQEPGITFRFRDGGYFFLAGTDIDTIAAALAKSAEPVEALTAEQVADHIGVTPYSDMRPFVVQAVKYVRKMDAALAEPAGEPDADEISPYEWLACEFDRLAILRKMWTAHEVAATIRQHDIERTTPPAAVQPERDAELAQMREVVDEGLEILVTLIDSITKHGNYSPESTCTFIDQAAQCFRTARAALSGSGAGWPVPEGYALVPVEPSRGRLISMAIRHDHAFLINPDPNAKWTSGVKPEHRESILRSMRQLYEEAIGAGFYSPDREGGYVSSFEKAQAAAPAVEVAK